MTRYTQQRFGLLAIMLAVPVLAADTPLRHNGYDFKPRDLKGAELHARIPFLQPERDWERVDIYIPQQAKGDKLPCVIVVYGGGYGEKVLPLNQVAPLLERGYVLAVPDYALQVQGAAALACWDIDNAVRFLRRNAAKYRIDPERIGIWGFSAGGWIIQNLCYSDSSELAAHAEGRSRVAGIKPSPPGFIPYVNPHPLYPEHSSRVQAAASDWGAGKLVDRKRDPKTRGTSTVAASRLSPDDPPLITCFPGTPREISNTSIDFLQALGIPAEPVFMDVKSTHVPKHTQVSKTADGKDTTWGEAVYDFFDRRLKNITVSTPPEIFVDASSAPDSLHVRLLNVHPDGKVHYTTDGSAPAPSSPTYIGPFKATPGMVIRAVAAKPGLKPSPVASFAIAREPAQPVITTETGTFTARAGQPFSATFAAKGDRIQWFATGRLGESYRKFGEQSFNPPAHIPWLEIDKDKGVLSGTPRHPGVYPVVVCAWSMSGTDVKNRPGSVKVDARLIVITVE